MEGLRLSPREVQPEDPEPAPQAPIARCYNGAMTPPNELLDTLWEWDAQLLEHHATHGPAVDQARALWQFVSLPVSGPSRLMEHGWGLGGDLHAALLSAIPQGPEAVVDAVANFFHAPNRDKVNTYALLGFTTLDTLCKKNKDGLASIAPPPALTQAEKEDATWLRARLASADFPYLSLSAYWMRDNAAPFVSGCARLVRTLSADNRVLSLGGRLGLRLAMQNPMTPNTRGQFSNNYDEIRVFSSRPSIFAHEWMHALEQIARKRRVAGYSKVWAAIKDARSALRTMSQDHLSAHRLVHQATEAVKPIIQDALQYFLIERASDHARSAFAPHGTVNNTFVRSFMDDMVAIADIKHREDAIRTRLSGLLAQDQSPLSDGGVADLAMVLQTIATVLAHSARGLSVFEINSRLRDKIGQCGTYWADTSEMLARACECYVLGHANQCDVLEGAEYAHLMEKMATVASRVSQLFPAQMHPAPPTPRTGATPAPIGIPARVTPRPS